MLAIGLPGFRIISTEMSAEGVCLGVRIDTKAGTCPVCGSVSKSVHSSYVRRLRDFPILGLPVEIQVTVRRFRCSAPGCHKQTFSERLSGFASPYAQRTQRMTRLLESLILVARSNVGALLARQIGIRTSPRTLLRVIHQGNGTIPTPRILGVDDFALRRGRTYGTLLCNLESRRPIDILPTRTAGPLTEWLKAHPGIQVIARDRAMAYAQAAAEAAPDAIQVADRLSITCGGDGKTEWLMCTFCLMKAPCNIRSQYHLAFRVRGNTLTLYECRACRYPGLQTSTRTPSAQFRYDPKGQVWRLYYADHNRRWHLYDRIEASPDLASLLAEVDKDPMGIFFGQLGM